MRLLNKFSLTILTFTLLFSFANTSFAQDNSINNQKLIQNKIGVLEMLPFLGEWEMDGVDHFTIESWKKISENTLEGRTIIINKKSKDTISSESILLTEMEYEVFYIAKVSHNIYPIPFKFTGLANSTYTFENPEHDFPKKITYKFESADKIVVEVSNGKRQMYFHFNRVKK